MNLREHGAHSLRLMVNRWRIRAIDLRSILSMEYESGRRRNL
jgi:hypothetical protein